MPKACIYAGFRHLFYQMVLFKNAVMIGKSKDRNVNFGHAAPRCVLQYGAMVGVDMKKKKLLINGQSEFIAE
jgi:muramoyltetrapeptide carboxypeptidase LdcA involved in peptidoglycan recycling